MTTAITTRATGGAPLREVGEGPPARGLRASVVAVVALLTTLVLLPLTQVVPPAVLVVGATLWLVLRLGDAVSAPRGRGGPRREA